MQIMAQERRKEEEREGREGKLVKIGMRNRRMEEGSENGTWIKDEKNKHGGEGRRRRGVFNKGSRRGRMGGNGVKNKGRKKKLKKLVRCKIEEGAIRKGRRVFF